jgi:hypothetical protein
MEENVENGGLTEEHMFFIIHPDDKWIQAPV